MCAQSPLISAMPHTGGAVRGARVPVLYVGNARTQLEYVLWQQSNPVARGGTLPAAVDRRTVTARPRIRAQLEALSATYGPLAFLTVLHPLGTGNTYRAASRIGPEMLRVLGMPGETVYAVHLARRPHTHSAVPLSAAPKVCPCCAGPLTPDRHVTHQGEIREGMRCPHGCTYLTPVDDLNAVAAYLAGPSDARAHYSKVERMNAAQDYLRSGRRVRMRGLLRRAPKYTGASIRHLIFRGRLLTKQGQPEPKGHRMPSKAPHRRPVRHNPRPVAGTPRKASYEQTGPPRRK